MLELRALVICALIVAVAAGPGKGAFGSRRACRKPALSVGEYQKHLEDLTGWLPSARRGEPLGLRSEPGGFRRPVQLKAGEPRASGLFATTGCATCSTSREKERGCGGEQRPIQVTKAPPVSIDTLLTQARERLAGDWKQGSTADEVGPDTTPSGSR